MSAVLLRKKKLYLKKLRKLQQRRLHRRNKVCWALPGQTEQLWLNLTTGLTHCESWKIFFRMTRSQFYQLVDEIRPFITPNLLSPNYRAITAERNVALSLYYLKDTGSLTITASTLRVASNTVGSVVFDVCDAISRNMGPEYLYLPRDKEGMMEKVSEFEAK